MGKLSGDVLGVALKYVEPFELVNFFVDNEISLDTKFLYDTDVALNVGSVNSVFGVFPNIVLIGLNLCNVKNNYEMQQISVRLDKLVHLMICGNGCELDYIFLERCKNIMSLEIKEVNINFKNVPVYGKLKCVRFVDCVWKSEDLVFSMCHRDLRVIDIPFRTVNKTLFDFFGKCLNLTKLCMNGYSNLKWEGRELCCKRLRVLKIRMCSYPNLKNLMVAKGCIKLRKIDASGVESIVSTDGIEGLGVRKIILANCWKLISVERLGECRRLRYLDISGCDKIESYDFLDRCVALKTLVVTKLDNDVRNRMEIRGVRIRIRA